MPTIKPQVKSDLYDFRNLFLVLFKSKYWIIGLSIASTILLVVFASTKEVIYQATANVSVGSYEVSNLDCSAGDIRESSACRKTFKPNALFMHSEDLRNRIIEFAVTNIKNKNSIKNNGNNTLTIKSIASSSEEAKKSLQKIATFVNQLNLKNIETINKQRNSIILDFEKKILNLKKWQLTPIEKRIDHGLLVFDKKIELQNQNLNFVIKQQNILNKNLVSTVSNSLSSKIIELAQEIETIKNFGLPKLLAQIKITKEAYEDTMVRINLFKVQDKASVRSQIDYIENFELPFYASKINNLKDRLIKNDSLLKIINLNEIYQTNSQDPNQINMISLRYDESRYLRGESSSLPDLLLDQELGYEILLIKYQKLLEVKESQDSGKFYLFSESGFSSDAFKRNLLFLQNLSLFLAESKAKLQDLESDQVSLLKKQDSLKSSLSLLQTYKDKWFATDTNNFDTSNLLDVFSTADALGFLSLGTTGQIKFTVETEIRNLERRKNEISAELSLLHNNRYSYVNFNVPSAEMEMFEINTEIINRQYQINEYKRLVSSQASRSTDFFGKIDAPKKPLSPNIALYAGFGFLGSLSLFLFIFSLLGLDSFSKKKTNI